MLKLFRRIRFLLQQGRVDGDLAQEVEFHRAMEAERLERAGLDESSARHASSRAMGNMTLAREDARAVWIAPWLESVLRDVAYACRLMVHRPGFAAAMILVMSLGIGAATGVFSLVDNLVLKSLPVRNPERLVYLEKPSFSYPIYQEVQARAGHLFSGLFAWNIDRLSVQWIDALEPLDVLMASGQFYSTLGVSTEIGRVLDPSDDRIGGGPNGLVAMISHTCWQRRFAANPAVVGRQVRVDRQMFTIVGVTPAGFFGVAAGLEPELTIPLTTLSDDAGLRAPSRSWVHVMGRLTDNVTLAEANAAFSAIWPGSARGDNRPRDASGSTREVSWPDDRAGFRAYRLFARAQSVRGAALGALRARRPAAGDRVRKRGESAAGSRRDPPPRDGRASGDWCEPRPARPSDAHRSVRLDGTGRRRRSAGCVVGKWVAGANAGDLVRGRGARREPRLARCGVRDHRRAARHECVRDWAGAARDAAQRCQRTQSAGNHRRRVAAALVVRERTRRRSNCVDGAAAHGRRTLLPKPPENSRAGQRLSA